MHLGRTDGSGGGTCAAAAAAALRMVGGQRDSGAASAWPSRCREHCQLLAQS
jgi:hypothetical protein